MDSYSAIPQPPRYEAVASQEIVQHPTLVPSLATRSNRYDRQYSVETASLTLTVQAMQNSLLTRTELSFGWVQDIHPEGNPVFSNESLHVVTDNVIDEPHIRACLESCAAELSILVKQREMKLPTVWHMCLSLDQDNEACNYYLVDHDNQKIFWAEEVEATEIGLPEAASPLQLGHALNDEYWVHAEFYPHSVPNIPAVTQRLARILTFGRSDQLTSDSSTFPYDASQCGDFLSLIRNSEHEGAEWTWFIARISSAIARHRFDTFYGEHHARISREQRRLGERAATKGFVSRALDLALFHSPSRIADELETLHVDNIVYTIHWRRFITERLEDWRESFLYTIGVLLVTLGGLIYSPEGPSHYAGLAGAMLATLSMLSSALLLQRYAGTQKLHAANVTDHVRELDHSSLGYYPSAALYSLPRALQTWALLAFFIQLVLMILPPCSLMPACAIFTFALLSFFIISAVLSVASRVWGAVSPLRRFFLSSRVAQCTGSMIV